MRLFGVEELRNLYRSPEGSHKGQNGRVLVLGGSALFHASIFWSADVASRVVDLVHFSSPAMENNELVRVKAKEKLWSGIVVPWERVPEYVAEDDCVLIGPGMPRLEGLMKGERPTAEIINPLFKKFARKRWVVDGGALQEMDVSLITEQMILTPHQGEFGRLFNLDSSVENARKMALKYGCTILLKGAEDYVVSREEVVRIAGGNAGLTKGGTGDVLAGLTAAFYCKNEPALAAAAASYVLKRTGDVLFERVGEFYSAGDVVAAVPEVLSELLG